MTVIGRFISGGMCHGCLCCVMTFGTTATAEQTHKQGAGLQVRCLRMARLSSPDPANTSFGVPSGREDGADLVDDDNASCSPAFT